MASRQPARQTLASYALFEDARKAGRPLQHALLPLILPFIAGKGGQIFSAEGLAKALQQLFGPAFNAYSAEALVPMLEVEGYVRSDLVKGSDAVYLYTELANDITVDSSVSEAQADLEIIIDEYMEFLRETKPLVALSYGRDEWRDQFLRWATAVDTSGSKNFEGWLDSFVAKEKKNAVKLSGNEEPEERFATLDRHVIVLFASFVQWLSRERRDLFEKVAVLVEIGLIIDLISELRAPLKEPPSKIALTVVLDGPVILDALGLSGPGRKHAAECMLQLCKRRQIKVITLEHCLAEAREIVVAVLNNDAYHRGGFLGDALRGDKKLEAVARRFVGSPEAQLSKLGVDIVNAAQQAAVQEKQVFSDDLLDDFAAKLPYQGVHITQRKVRDAKSVAFVMRRRARKATSDIFTAKYVLVTRSPVLAKFSARFMARWIEDYPEYAISPAVEVRHFSTMCMLTFGSDLGEPISRSELLSSCERVLRTSPEIVRKVRESMEQMALFTTEELDALMTDPVALYEITTVTGNDPAVVNVENAAALAEAIRNSTAKTERLNAAASKRALQEAHLREMETERAKYEAALEAERARAVDAQALADSAQATMLVQEKALDELAETLFDGWQRDAQRYWFVVAAAFSLISAGAVADLFLDVSHFSTAVRITLTACIIAIAIYSWASRVLERFSLLSLKRLILVGLINNYIRKNPDSVLRGRISDLLAEAKR